jgi:hypothetical protein
MARCPGIERARINVPVRFSLWPRRPERHGPGYRSQTARCLQAGIR